MDTTKHIPYQKTSDRNIQGYINTEIIRINIPKLPLKSITHRPYSRKNNLLRWRANCINDFCIIFDYLIQNKVSVDITKPHYKKFLFAFTNVFQSTYYDFFTTGTYEKALELASKVFNPKDVARELSGYPYSFKRKNLKPTLRSFFTKHKEIKDELKYITQKVQRNDTKNEKFVERRLTCLICRRKTTHYG
jgi:hypothetical protein